MDWWRLHLGDWLKERKNKNTELKTTRGYQKSYIFLLSRKRPRFPNRIIFQVERDETSRVRSQIRLSSRAVCPSGGAYSIFNFKGTLPDLLIMNLWECGGTYIFNSIHRGDLYTWPWRRHCLLSVLYLDLVGGSWL